MIVLWFLGGLAVVAAISWGAMYLLKAKSVKDVPMDAEHLPKDWESVMPREKKTQTKTPKGNEPSFRKIGVKQNSTSRGSKNLR